YPDPADPEQPLETLGIADKRDTPFRKLSGGQKQRLSIALALVGNPEIAVLDELTTGLDPQARRDTWDLIEDVRDRGVTILLGPHVMEDAGRLWDRLALIGRGRVVARDSPSGPEAKLNDERRIRVRLTGPSAKAKLLALPEVH